MEIKTYSAAEKKLLKVAFFLAMVTIFYNIAEGVLSTIFGFADDTIALFGFGIDSFVEVISGAGIGHMIWRMGRSPVSSRDRFERQALYITGTAFFLLAAGLAAGSVINFIQKSKPDSTVAGIVISSISIATMWFLYRYKLSVGKRLVSEPIIADAHCTKTCFYLSFVLLASSILYEVLEIGYIDIAGGLGIAVFAVREGIESFEKARSGSLSCSCGEDSCH